MFTQLPFMTKGLLVALLGLGGTFLVLVLIYLAVTLMKKMSGKDREQQ